MLKIGQSARKDRWQYRWTFKSMTPELGYILGVYLGDGSIVSNKQSLRFVLQAIDEDFVVHTRNCFLKELNCPLSDIHRYVYSGVHAHPVYKFTLDSGDIAEWLVNITKCKQRIPTEIPREKNNPIMVEFLKGFLDSEGYISMTEDKRWNTTLFMVGFGGVSAWIHEIKELLEIQGCNITGPQLLQRKPHHHMYYGYRITPKTFIDSNLDFNIERKHKKVMLLRQKYYTGTPSETVYQTPKQGEETVQA